MKHQKCKTCHQQTHRWEPCSKDSLKHIGPSGQCHSPQVFQSHHHERGATSDLLHDPRGYLVKPADSDTGQSEHMYMYYMTLCAVRLPWDKSDMTLVLGSSPWPDHQSCATGKRCVFGGGDFGTPTYMYEDIFSPREGRIQTGV